MRYLKAKVALFGFLVLLPVTAAANFHEATAPDDGFRPTRTTSSGGGLQNPLAADSLTEFLVQVLNALQLVVFPFIVLFLVYGGFLFITAQGNEEKLKTAKRVFLWTLVGALVILGAEVLSRAVEATIQNFR